MRGPNAAASAPSSNHQRGCPASGGRSVTGRSTPPAIATLAAYESYTGSKATTSSPGSTSPWTASKMASVAPQVTTTSVSGSTASPRKRRACSVMAWRSATAPSPGAYWFSPLRSAATAASRTTSGPVEVGEALAQVHRARSGRRAR